MRKWERGTVGCVFCSAFRVPNSDMQPHRLFRYHIHRPIVLGEPAAYPQKRLTADRRSVPVVHVRSDDHVRHPSLVLEEHENESLGRFGALARDHQPGDFDRSVVLEPGERVALYHARWERAAQQGQGMAARREPQDVVFSEQPLGRLEPAESESFVWMIERKLELAPSPPAPPPPDVATT